MVQYVSTLLLTKANSKTVELQQKRSLAFILGADYPNYSHALGICSLPRLDSLREETTLKWAIKAQANPQHSILFPVNPSTANTRSRKTFKEYMCKGSKFYCSAVPAMVRSLNSHSIHPAGRHTKGSIPITTNSGIDKPV